MLDNVKMLLGVTGTDLDEQLEIIIASVTSRLRLLIGMTPPESLSYIIEEVAVIRFNRIGSEGMSAQSMDGESNTYIGSDFSGFMDDINAFKTSQDGNKTGVLRFL